MNRLIQPFAVPSGTWPRFGKIGPWAFGVALACLLIAAGCATAGSAPPPTTPAPAGTKLEVVNLTNYEWRIVIDNPAGNESLTARVGPQATNQISLRGGEYLIEQTVITGHPGPELSRRIPARLEPGQTYRWPLVTLLSDSTAEAGSKKQD